MSYTTQGMEQKATQEIIHDAYMDYLSTQTVDLPNPRQLLVKVEEEVKGMEDFDCCVDQARYAIVMKTISDIATNNTEEIMDFRNLSIDEKYERAIPYQWQPTEYEDLDNLLWTISEHAFGTLLGTMGDNEDIEAMIAQAQADFNTLWSHAIDMETSYGDHLYLVELLSEKEDEFYKDVAVIQGLETEDYSMSVADMLADHNIHLADTTYEEPADEIQELLEDFEGTLDELTAKIKAEGYEILDCHDGEIVIGDGYGVNSMGMLN